MKGFGGLVVVILAVIGVTYMLGSMGIEVPALGPIVDQIVGRADDVGVPDVNEAGNKASDAADSAADEVSTWSLQTWKLIVIGLVATALTILWFRNPRFRYIIIGCGIMLVIMIGFIPQFQ